MPAKKRGGCWVDFRRIEEQVRFEQVLQYCGLLDGLRRQGEELVGNCPLHDERRFNKYVFSVNTTRNIFHCFACGASGNVLDFVCQRENLEPRETALTLQGRQLSDSPHNPQGCERSRPQRRPLPHSATATQCPQTTHNAVRASLLTAPLAPCNDYPPSRRRLVLPRFPALRRRVLRAAAAFFTVRPLPTAPLLGDGNPSRFTLTPRS